MKNKIKHITLYASLVVIGVLWITGCGGDGGGSGDDGGDDGGTQPVVASVQLGTPICSVDGAGSVNGPSFSGNQGQVTVNMDGDNPNAYMRVWLQVNVTGATASHYDWEIVGWQNQFPHGTIAYEDEVIDIDINQGIYKVRSYGNKVRYDSTSNSALTSNFSQQIKVTAWTSDGKYTTAYFTLFLVPASGGSGDDHGNTAATATIVTVNGNAASGEINPASDKDMFKFTATQGTSYSIETGGSLDTIIALYDRDGVLVLATDDDGGVDTSSLIDWACPVSGTYYVGVFSYNSQYTGAYTLSVDTSAASLTGVSITGPATVNEQTTAVYYTCTAYYSDGSSQIVTPTWSDNSSYASITSAGELRTLSVGSDLLITITATYQGESATKSVTIKDIQSPPPATKILRISGDLNFGNVSVGSYADKVLTFYNDGTETITINTLSSLPGFDMAVEIAGYFTVPAGGSRQNTFRFRPQSVRAYSGTWYINSDADSGQTSIGVICNGI